MAGLLDDYMAQVQDYKKAGSIGAGLLADRPDLELGKQGLLNQMQLAESKYIERISDPLTYYQENPDAQGLLTVSPELDLIDLATGGGKKATFIGLMSNTFNTKAYKLASDLLNKGATRDEIWNETSKLGAPMFKDIDGKWKQEISDEGLQYKEPTSLFNSIEEKSTRSIAAQRNFIENASDSDLNQIAKLNDSSLRGKDYKKYALEELDLESKDITKGTFRSGDVNVQPNFSAAYPSIDDVNIDYKKMIGSDSGTLGSISPSTGDVTLKAGYRRGGNSPNNPDMRSVMAHERQHWIQEKENFAKGGNPNTFQKGQLDQLMASMIERLKNNPANKDVPMETIREHAYRLVTSPDERYMAYRNLAGETESRNVQERLNMTMDQRIAEPPWLTLKDPNVSGIPQNEQIVAGQKPRWSDNSNLTVGGLLSNNRYD